MLMSRARVRVRGEIVGIGVAVFEFCTDRRRSNIKQGKIGRVIGELQFDGLADRVVSTLGDALRRLALLLFSNSFAIAESNAPMYVYTASCQTEPNPLFE